MKFSRLIVQILLVVAVVTSFVLSFFIWTNTARYQRGRNIDVSTSDVDKNKTPIDQIISPTQVIWQDGKDQRLIYNNKDNISFNMQSVIKDWKVGTFHREFTKDGAKYQHMIQQKNMIQLVYPTNISIRTLGYLMNNNQLQKAQDHAFNRIIFSTNNKDDDQVYLANDNDYSVYEAKVSGASAEPIIKLAKKANIDLKVKLNLMKHGVVTFYSEPITLKRYSYVMSTKADSEYTTNLFDANTDDINNSTDGNVTTYSVGESKRLVSDRDKNELTFSDYTDTSVPKDYLTFFQRGYKKATNIQNSVSNLRLYDANWKNKTLVYREYVEGFPIFKKSEFGSIKIVFSRNGSSEQFLNKVLEVPVPSDLRSVSLKPTTEIVKELNNVGYSPNDIQKLEVGYQWTNEDDNSNVIDLEPTYYIKMDNHWRSFEDWTGVTAESTTSSTTSTTTQSTATTTNGGE
ncbi:YycH family regulatory protein [Companilactobacillus sp.]|jgi:regulatory protein YycH of two-component signal transduction system YycFG|uniref:YycH family regulatory protein n=1 Tax=Companilactobacillus sp. TaxID=2767905 RepID=UPI0025C08A53|nr:two-component system activity regulator YycH [Companilactobacillus sp.]MCH4009133.1 two-component system activity regulator YycH [Companilactobacillus sp.]MCH4050688.1 two-component system activity regulator YycH [Companilactobacillus sp.]MCH4077075.1 two-component system activity regulator YycH [Companilactobacillus sp.]MCH4125651.1 two-component system activity regulator YycH [Companilactobacillus sp.]MCI1311360.1 two-component system activity regulator YycH [Companilactobacillus sp.]